MEHLTAHCACEDCKSERLQDSKSKEGGKALANAREWTRGGSLFEEEE